MSFLDANKSRDVYPGNNSHAERNLEVRGLSKIRSLISAALFVIMAGLPSGCSQTVKAPCPPSPCPTSDAGVDAGSKLRSDKKSKPEESHGWADVEMVGEKCGIDDDLYDGGVEIGCTP